MLKLTIIKKQTHNMLSRYTTDELRGEINNRINNSKTEIAIEWLKENNLRIGDKIYAKCSAGNIYLGDLVSVDEFYFKLGNLKRVHFEFERIYINKKQFQVLGCSSLICLYLHTGIDFNNTEDAFCSNKRFLLSWSDVFKHGLEKSDKLKSNKVHMYTNSGYAILFDCKSNKHLENWNQEGEIHLLDFSIYLKKL